MKELKNPGNLKRKRNKCSFCKEPCGNKWCSYGQDRGKIRQDR